MNEILTASLSTQQKVRSGLLRSEFTAEEKIVFFPPKCVLSEILITLYMGRE